MNSRYWDIGDFLCEEERVMGRFNCDSYENG
jgi:hypothetical protein